MRPSYRFDARAALAEQPNEKRHDERDKPQIIASTYAQDEPRGDNETGDPLQFDRAFVG